MLLKPEYSEYWTWKRIYKPASVLQNSHLTIDIFNMISLVIRITFVFALLTTFIEARRHRRRFGLKIKKTDNSNDVVIKTQYDQCSQFCRPNPKQFVKIINEQWVITDKHYNVFNVFTLASGSLKQFQLLQKSQKANGETTSLMFSLLPLESSRRLAFSDQKLMQKVTKRSADGSLPSLPIRTKYTSKTCESLLPYFSRCPTMKGLFFSPRKRCCFWCPSLVTSHFELKCWPSSPQLNLEAHLKCQL